MTNATALFHLISRVKKEKREFDFAQLQRVPAFRIPECQFTFGITSMGIFEYVVRWSGIQGSPSGIDQESAATLFNQKNFDKFIDAHAKSHFLQDFGNTASSQGLRPFNVFDAGHDRKTQPPSGTFEKRWYWLKHPYGGGPFLETAALWLGLHWMGTSFSGSAFSNPEWFLSLVGPMGWVDPTGTIFFTAIFIAAIFSLLHRDLWKALLAEAGRIKSSQSEFNPGMIFYEGRRVLSLIFVFFLQRLIGGLLFVGLLQVPVVGFVLSVGVHAFLNGVVFLFNNGEGNNLARVKDFFTPHPSLWEFAKERVFMGKMSAWRYQWAARRDAGRMRKILEKGTSLRSLWTGSKGG
ncbi:MAG: hypothetical protein IPN90_04615 [Elusimicrobia bacterium]|nr:hypothetical protein [Elusimicrobiota bacterium]